MRRRGLPDLGGLVHRRPGVLQAISMVARQSATSGISRKHRSVSGACSRPWARAKIAGLVSAFKGQLTTRTLKDSGPACNASVSKLCMGAAAWQMWRGEEA